MVLGHYGLALGAKRLAPRSSLGFLVLAAQLADLFWPIMLLCGVESVEIVRGRPALAGSAVARTLAGTLISSINHTRPTGWVHTSLQVRQIWVGQ
jgi:hypothetical protein